MIAFSRLVNASSSANVQGRVVVGEGGGTEEGGGRTVEGGTEGLEGRIGLDGEDSFLSSFRSSFRSS